MKKTLLVAAAALTALFAGGAAMAQDDAGGLSYNLAVTNNYVWRGISQTNDKAALQGGIDYKKGTFYAGAWASNVDFDYGDNGASTELDLYMGLTPTVGNWSFDFGAIAYTYPSSGGDAIGELKAAVSHPMGAGTIGTALYLPTETMDDPYYEVNASYPLSSNVTLSGAIGNFELNSGTCALNPARSCTGYTTANVGITYAFNDTLSLDLRASDASKGYDGKTHDYILATLKAGF